MSWFWGWLLNARDARLITGDARLDIQVPRPPEFVPDEAPSVSDGNGARAVSWGESIQGKSP